MKNNWKLSENEIWTQLKIAEENYMAEINGKCDVHVMADLYEAYLYNLRKYLKTQGFELLDVTYLWTDTPKGVKMVGIRGKYKEENGTGIVHNLADCKRAVCECGQ